MVDEPRPLGDHFLHQRERRPPGQYEGALAIGPLDLQVNPDPLRQPPHRHVLGQAEDADLPDIAPLLPDVDVIDDLSENLGDEPRFAKLAGKPAAEQPLSFEMDKD